MIERLALPLAAVGSLLAAYAMLYLSAAFFAPRFFLTDLSLNDERFRKISAFVSRPKAYRWSYYIAGAALIIGILVLAYHAAGALTAWIPAEWQRLNEDGEEWSVRSSLQLFLGLAIAAYLLVSVSTDASAHDAVPPKGYRLSAWARQGYEFANEAIKYEKVVKAPDQKPSHFTMEFRQGFALRIAEEARLDAQSGRYRPAEFNSESAYVEAWIQAAAKLRGCGWSHPEANRILDEDSAFRSAAHAAAEKEKWKERLDFDPDEVLGHD